MQFFTHKKGSSLKMISSIIFAILVFILLLYLLTDIFQKSEDLKPHLSECRLILGAQGLLDDIPSLANKITANCYTVKLDEMNDLRRINDIERYVGNRMAQSWWVTLEGSEGLFDDNGYLTTAGYDCMTLFDLDYNNPKYKETISQVSLYNYLNTETYSKKDMTYNRYFQGKKGNGAWVIMDDLEPGKNYAVSIMNPRDESFLIQAANLIDSLALRGSGMDQFHILGIPSFEQSLKNIVDDGNFKTIIAFSTLERAQQMKCHYGVKES